MGEEVERQPQAPAPEAVMPEAQAPEQKQMAPPEEEMATFDDKPPVNTGLVLLWITAVIAILATAFFWWSGRNIGDRVAEENAKTDQIAAQINSPGMKDISKQAQDFKSSVTALSAAEAARFPYAVFLPELFSKITKESSISAISVAKDGKINITAKAKSYRGAAEFATALSDWDVLSSVDLGTVSFAVSDGGEPQSLFSLTAQINKEKWKAAHPSTDAGGSQ